MSTPFGDFVHAKRDTIAPADVGLTAPTRRRSPGLRRSELATRAGISVEYLTRIEQGRDRNPSPSVLTGLADALRLDPGENRHLRYLAKIAGGACAAHRQPAAPSREVREPVRAVLQLLEPAVAIVTNRLGDVLAHTSGFDLLMRPTGLLEADQPNLTTYVFTDPRARVALPDWDQVADEQVFDLWLGPSASTSEWFTADLAPSAGSEFTRRLGRHLPPPHLPLRVNHPELGCLSWDREVLELSPDDQQLVVVFLPTSDETAAALEMLRRRTGPRLRAVGHTAG